MPGPLAGVTVIELAGLGPAPFAGMLLADLGAEVVRVDRAFDAVGGHTTSSRHDLLNRGKLSIGVDLKHVEGPGVVLDLVERSEILIEGFRPGVAERLGIGPEACLQRSPSLVYGRMTGWGQDGPLADTAGHDIDYIALSGALGSIGTSDDPVVPLNLVADFGGGGMLLATGVLAGLTHARATGEGQVVDASMVDGSALLMTSHHGFLAEGWWSPGRESNQLDGAAPYYTTYRTSDGGHVAVGALEPQFYAELLDRLGLEAGDLPERADRSGWPAIREALAKRFAEKTRDEWAAAFAGSDACVVPVLDMVEARAHPHNKARTTFVEIDGISQPGAAPRYSRTQAAARAGPPFVGEHTDDILAGLGYSQERIGMLKGSQAVS